MVEITRVVEVIENEFQVGKLYQSKVPAKIWLTEECAELIINVLVGVRELTGFITCIQSSSREALGEKKRVRFGERS